jgi:3-oxoacyl-[acyl-carrier-protein] synthase-1
MTAIPVLGYGCVTPVGLSAPMTCSALRAGMSRILEFAGWNDAGLSTLECIAGRVPLEWLRGEGEPEWPGHERWKLRDPQPQVLVTPSDHRLTELALPAAEEAWAHAGRPQGRIGLYLGLDESDTGAHQVDAIASHLGLRFELERADRFGRAAAFAALHRATRHLAEGRIDIALVGGVDSLLRHARLAKLAEDGRLKSDDNPSGSIPAEAAAFLVLGAPDSRVRPRGWVRGTGVAEEPTVRAGEPNRGRGLTEAIRAARAGVGLQSQPLVVNDFDGDRYRALEWGLVSTRALGDLPLAEGASAAPGLWHPADCVGDAGAGLGGVNLVWALTALRKRYATSDPILVYGASDGPLRAAAIVSSKEGA